MRDGAQGGHRKNMITIRCETGFDVQVDGDTLAGAKLADMDLHRALLDGADLRGADFSRSELRSAWLEGAKLDDANLSHSILAAANASKASFVRVHFQHAMLRAGIFEDANFAGASLVSANVGGARFARASFVGADMRCNELGEADLRGAYYSPSTLWPEGFDPNAHGLILREGS